MRFPDSGGRGVGAGRAGAGVYDEAADAALFQALYDHVRQTDGAAWCCDAFISMIRCSPAPPYPGSFTKSANEGIAACAF